MNSLINYINKTCNRHKGLKTTNESSSIPRQNLSFGISIDIFIINDISHNTLKNNYHVTTKK